MRDMDAYGNESFPPRKRPMRRYVISTRTAFQSIITMNYTNEEAAQAEENEIQRQAAILAGEVYLYLREQPS